MVAPDCLDIQGCALKKCNPHSETLTSMSRRSLPWSTPASIAERLFLSSLMRRRTDDSCRYGHLLMRFRLQIRLRAASQIPNRSAA